MGKFIDLQWGCKIFNFLKNESGSFTIEATFVYPLVLCCTLALLFISLWTYERASLQQKSAITADRAAFVWDNSTKDVITGAFDIHENDGLYWRFGSDGLGDSTTLRIPNEALESSTVGPRVKLNKAAETLTFGSTSLLTYTNKLVQRRVNVQLTQVMKPMDMLKSWFGDSKTLQAQSNAYISEPVEFIRNTNLALTYIPRIKELITPEDAARSIENAIPQQNKAIKISSELEASRYIQALVHGPTVFIPTEESGQYRKIDALDADGIAHEAKYTVNQTEARQEMIKDVELMKKGKVKGVVWHFFRNIKTGHVDLTPSLRKALELNGIVVVIHN
jgi:hypothetical protein